jgi:hypothetical protein
MRKYNSTYYLLFILLIMGTFASMAQNGYGLKIIGAVAFTFSVLFLIQLLDLVKKKDKIDAMGMIELISLSLWSIILGMRVFFIHFVFVEMLYVLAGLLLISVYLIRMRMSFRQIKPKSTLLAWLVLIFHASIVLYLVSMTTAPFAPLTSELAGGGAFLLIILFLAFSLINKKINYGSESISPFRLITCYEDRSIVMISLFVLFSVYVGLTSIQALPRMYFDEYPQVYYQLINQSQSLSEDQVGGDSKEEAFRKQYELFLKHHPINQ